MADTVWAVTDEYGNRTLARPVNGGTVEIQFTTERHFTRAEWKEFNSQVNDLFDIAESK